MKKYAAKATNFANPLVFYRISDTMNLFKANIFERLGESGLLMFESSNSQHVCFYKESPVGLGNPPGLSCVYPRICDNRMICGYFITVWWLVDLCVPETFIKWVSLLDTKGMRSKQDLDNINAILQVSYEANKEIYEQIREEDFAMCEALRDLFKDELQEQYEAGMSQGIEQGISQGIEQGISRGIEQGISQGISRRDITIIHNMQKNNFTMNQMMLATGKTESEIKKILETN